MNSKIESPCLECTNMVQCRKMCYKRLEWGVLEANISDEELQIYGNNIKIKNKSKILKQQNNYDEEVKQLLKDFRDIFKQEVVGYILSQQDKSR